MEVNGTFFLSVSSSLSPHLSLSISKVCCFGFVILFIISMAVSNVSCWLMCAFRGPWEFAACRGSAGGMFEGKLRQTEGFHSTVREE